jgi:hypothetical protein
MALSDKKLVQAGQVEIEEVMIFHNDGVAVDILNQVDSVTIYEDIYSPFTTGFLSVTDTLDMPGLLGRSGRDLIRLRIFTPSIGEASYIDDYFVIYKMAERSEVKDRMQGYNLYFASLEFMIDMQKTVSKTFSGTPSSIAKTILETQLGSTKKFNFDVSANSLKYTSNFWSPSKNLTYLSSHSVDGFGASSYMFFQNRSGYNFRTLEGLGKGPIVQKFSGNDFTTDTNTTDGANRFGTVKRDPIKDYASVGKVSIDTTYDFLRDYNDGMIKTKMYSHDLTTKRLDIKRVDLASDSMNRMNANNFYTDDVVKTSEPLLMNMSRHTGVSNEGDSTDYKFKQRRIMQLGQFRSGVVEIEVYGRTDYTVGAKVNLNLNRMKVIGKEDSSSTYIDKLYSGNYIITAVVHRITRAEHKCNLELAKSHTNNI